MTPFEEIQEVEMTVQPKRPTFLLVLCILTFVNTGFSLITLFFGLFHGPVSEEEMVEQRVQLIRQADEMRSLNVPAMADFMDQVQRMAEAINAHFYANSLVSMANLLLGVIATVFMLKGRKIGFHSYIAYSLLSAIQVYFFVSPVDIPTLVVVFNLLLSAIFVFLYSRNLSWINDMENKRLSSK
jgi:hypothetical protein